MATAAESQKNLDIRIEGPLAWVALNRPPANTLTMDFMQEIMDAFAALEANDEIFGACLTAAPGSEYFSNGIDAAYLLERDVDGRAAVFGKLIEMLAVLYGFSKPMTAVIDGHAMAGGAVLGIVADFRMMAAERGRYSFSEVAVGLMIPDFLLDIIRGVVGPQHMIRVAQLATAFKPEEALAIGLVDAVVPADRLRAQATRHMEKIFKLPQKSLRAVKTELRKDILARVKNPGSVADTVLFRELLGSYNFVEGLSAVRDNRRPRFKN